MDVTSRDIHFSILFFPISIISVGEVMRGTLKMEAVERFDVPVVTEEYLDAIQKGGAKSMLTQYAIAPWGGEVYSSSTPFFKNSHFYLKLIIN